MSCYFLPYSEVNRRYVDIYPVPRGPTSHPHSTPPIRWSHSPGMSPLYFTAGSHQPSVSHTVVYNGHVNGNTYLTVLLCVGIRCVCTLIGPRIILEPSSDWAIYFCYRLPVKEIGEISTWIERVEEIVCFISSPDTKWLISRSLLFFSLFWRNLTLVGCCT